MISASQDLSAATSPEMKRQFKDDDGWLQPSTLDAAGRRPGPADTGKPGKEGGRSVITRTVPM